MNERRIAAVEVHHVALPPRREHRWTGLTEPIGGYVLLKVVIGIAVAVAGTVALILAIVAVIWALRVLL